MTASSQPEEDFSGLWTRSLLAWPDGRRDETTRVAWLQGPSLFADLRQPAGRPDDCQLTGPYELTPKACAWLARQNGFAGVFSHKNGIAEWRREIEFQPPSALPDAGHLEWQGDLLVETGLHEPYVEHWHRGSDATHPRCAFQLESQTDGRLAILLRSGPVFMLARGRPPGIILTAPDLASCMETARNMTEMRAILDCEISFGRAGTGWAITHSTLPWREGQYLSVQRDGQNLNLNGVLWKIIFEEGEGGFS